MRSSRRPWQSEVPPPKPAAAQTYSGRLNGGQFFCAGTLVQIPIISGHWTVSIDPNTPAQVTLNVFYDGRHHLAFGYNALMLLSYSGGVYIFSGVRRQRHGRARHKLFAREVLLERRTRRRLSPESPVRLAHLSRRSEPLTFRNFGSEIIADNLKKRGWTWGCVSSVDSEGRTIWIADAHRGHGQAFHRARR